MLKLLKNNQGEILNLLFQDPDQEYFLRQIARRLNKEPGQIQNAIARLIDEQIIQDERKGNLRLFRLNKDHVLYQEIKSIVAKTLGWEQKLKALFVDQSKVDCAFVFGSFASNRADSHSDIDLMIIGELDENRLTDQISRLEGELNRELNYHLYSRDEALKKLKQGNDFLRMVFQGSKIILKGGIDEYAKFTKLNWG